MHLPPKVKAPSIFDMDISVTTGHVNAGGGMRAVVNLHHTTPPAWANPDVDSPPLLPDGKVVPEARVGVPSTQPPPTVLNAVALQERDMREVESAMMALCAPDFGATPVAAAGPDAATVAAAGHKAAQGVRCVSLQAALNHMQMRDSGSVFDKLTSAGVGSSASFDTVLHAAALAAQHMSDRSVAAHMADTAGSQQLRRDLQLGRPGNGRAVALSGPQAMHAGALTHHQRWQRAPSGGRPGGSFDTALPRTHGRGHSRGPSITSFASSDRGSSAGSVDSRLRRRSRSPSLTRPSPVPRPRPRSPPPRRPVLKPAASAAPNLAPMRVHHRKHSAASAPVPSADAVAAPEEVQDAVTEIYRLRELVAELQAQARTVAEAVEAARLCAAQTNRDRDAEVSLLMENNEALVQLLAVSQERRVSEAWKLLYGSQRSDGPVRRGPGGGGGGLGGGGN